MDLRQIDFKDLIIKPIPVWRDNWLLLACGDFTKSDFNAMTVGWGSFGNMWGKPFAQIVVRPSRFTYEFLERNDSFTLSAFPKKYRKNLLELGSKSGRDSDKISESGLTPISSQKVFSPSFAEAELTFECRKTYFQDMDKNNFLSEEINKQYPNQDYHRIYFGEIVCVMGISEFSANHCN